MQFPAAASGMFLLVFVTVLAVGSASATVAPAVELSIIDDYASRLTYKGNKSVQCVTEAGFIVLDHGTEGTPSTEAAVRSCISFQDGRVFRGRLTCKGNKPVQSVTEAGFIVLGHGTEGTPSTEAAVRSCIRLQDGRVFRGSRLTCKGNKPVQSVMEAGFIVLDHGIERTPSTEANMTMRGRIRLQDDRVFRDSLTYQGSKPVQSVTAAGIETTPPSATEAAVRSRIRLQAALTVTVDQSGKGNYTRIQDAINAVPENSSRSADGVLIKIMPGTYSEKVYVNKTGISLIGTSASSTIVTWSGRWTSEDSATIYVRSSDFVARSITFQNTYGRGAQAIAARVSGDRAAFYECRFVSYQDTILDDAVDVKSVGRHYYSNCYVEGATDFMFGRGKAFFEKCHLNSTSTNGGAFTAHGRNATADNTGFSFVDCSLTGIGAGKSILGRPWRAYARVVFARCNMSNAVDPVGWNNWDNADNERTSFFGQFQCYGEGSRTDGRTNWTHNHLSPAEVQPFLTKEAWVNGKDWIK